MSKNTKSNIRYILSTFLGAFLLYALLCLVYIVIDPYQVFGTSITRLKFDFTKYYSKVQYDMLKRAHFSLVFGTSQSAKISTKNVDFPLLNFMDIYGEPREILYFLEALDKKQLANINHIYYMISLHTMREAGEEKIDYSLPRALGGIPYAFPLSPEALQYILRDIAHNLGWHIVYTLDVYGSQHGSPGLAKMPRALPKNIIDKKGFTPTHDYLASVSSLIALDAFIRAHKIPHTYYTPTFSNQRGLSIAKAKDLYARLTQANIKVIGLYYIDGVSNCARQTSKKGTMLYPYFTDSVHLDHDIMNALFAKRVARTDAYRLAKEGGYLIDETHFRSYFDNIYKGMDKIVCTKRYDKGG